ncbi:MAG: GNAT family N-acetyltransferase [Candidatus Bipolaricaulota bacterium]|nr:GNAT family N-acetyltransferase [Candidatus Bipolaricaulota bacterium]
MKEHPDADCTISTDKARLDVGLIHDFLSRSSYWAQGRPVEQVRTSIENSLCFGAYEGRSQVGFARVVTDYATFAWLCDVFVLESHRGQGIGKRLIQAVVEHPTLRDLRLMILATRDAQGLYSEYGGFRTIEAAGRWMIRRGSENPTDCTRQTPGA